MPTLKNKKKEKKSVTPRVKRVHPLQKQYFLEEQEQFFKDNPSAKMLLSIFILTIIVFIVVIFITRY